MQEIPEKVFIDGLAQSRGIIVFYRDNPSLKFLLIKSAQGGHWTFPKGHMHKGEEDLECARREVWEETGLKDLEVLDGFLQSECYRSFGDEKCVKYFLGETHSKDFVIDNEEVSDAEWLDYESASDRLTYERSKETLLSAKKFLDENL